MTNIICITLGQNLPTWIGDVLRRFKNTSKSNEAATAHFIEGIDRDLPTGDTLPRHALVLFNPAAWQTAIREHPHITYYNQSGFIFSIVRALNQCGYLVDLVDPTHTKRHEKSFALVVAHGGHCRSHIEQLPPTVPVFQYIAGLFWEAFDRESDERYTRFFAHHNTPKPEIQRRSFKDQIEGLKFLNERADTLFSFNCPRLVAEYGDYAGKFCFAGLGAYPDPRFRIHPAERNHETGRKNFIYVGGTGGNLIKGLDLLLEAFARTPELHLYIYCKVEEEILRFCRKELSLPNIHYIYHWRYKPFHRRLKNLLGNTSFSVHAPINTGLGTAFMATMGEGMIPVGYLDLFDPGESAVLTDSWQVDALEECIRRASKKSPDWCRKASGLTREKYLAHCDPQAVEGNFRKMFASANTR